MRKLESFSNSGEVRKMAARLTSAALKSKANLRRPLLLASFLLFAGGLVLAVGSAPETFSNLQLAPFLILLAVCLVLQQTINAAEFHFMAKIGGAAPTWRASIETAFVASASNMLPLPGGAITRIAALRRYGVATADGALLNGLAVAVWALLVCALSGAWLLNERHYEFFAGVSGCGAISLLCCVYLFRRFHAAPSNVSALFMVRIIGLGIDAARLILAFQAVGASLPLSDASLLIASSFLSSLIALAPSGLGVREIAVAILSPLVGFSASLGFLSSVVNRVAGISALLILGLFMLVTTKRRHGDLD